MRQAIAALPARRRLSLWLALLVVASVAFTIEVGGAVPLAAFGAAAALSLSRRDALLLIVSVWLANQIVGYVDLSYPRSMDSVVGGVALGLAAVLAALAARGAAYWLARAGQAAAALAAFLAACAAYEAVLFVLAAVLPNGADDFAPGIIGGVIAINAAAMVGLLVLNRLGAAIGLVAVPASRSAEIERHA